MHVCHLSPCAPPQPLARARAHASMRLTSLLRRPWLRPRRGAPPLLTRARARVFLAPPSASPRLRSPSISFAPLRLLLRRGGSRPRGGCRLLLPQTLLRGAGSGHVLRHRRHARHAEDFCLSESEPLQAFACRCSCLASVSRISKCERRVALSSKLSARPEEALASCCE